MNLTNENLKHKKIHWKWEEEEDDDDEKIIKKKKENIFLFFYEWNIFKLSNYHVSVVGIGREQCIRSKANEWKRNSSFYICNKEKLDDNRIESVARMSYLWKKNKRETKNRNRIMHTMKHIQKQQQQQGIVEKYGQCKNVILQCKCVTEEQK